MPRRLLLGLAIILSSVGASIVPALAHAPIKGIGTFYNGVLHPVLVPAHLLLVVGVGLLLGQHTPGPSRYGWFSFVAAFWIGLAAGQTVGMTLPQSVLLTATLVVGGCVALTLSLGVLPLAGVMAAAGVGIGLDSRPETAGGSEAWIALSGTAIGGVLLLSYIGGLTACLTRPWQRIGIRVAGSWTAASAAIVLALALAGQDAAPPALERAAQESRTLQANDARTAAE